MKWIFFILIALYTAAPAYSASNIVNGTAGRVDGKTISILDLRFFLDFTQYRTGKKVKGKTERERLINVAQKYLFQEMVYSQLRSFNFRGVSKAQATGELNAIRSSRGEGPLKKILAKYQKRQSELVALMHKTLLVEKFVQQKVETLTPIITETEVERYYQQHQSRFRGSKLDEIRPSIEVLLKKQKVEKGLEEWIQFLKSKYRVTNLLAEQI